MDNKKTKKMLDWNKRIIQLSLDYEIYPNSNVPDTFLLVNQKELKVLIENTKKRIEYYNKNIKPKDWAGYSKYGNNTCS